MASWQDTTWDDSRIVEEDEKTGGQKRKGTLLRLSYPDGTIIYGRLTVAPQGRGLVRLKSPYAGDQYLWVEEAIVAVFVGDEEPS